MTFRSLVVVAALLDPIYGSLPSCNNGNGCSSSSQHSAADPAGTNEYSATNACQSAAAQYVGIAAMAIDLGNRTGDIATAIADDCASWTRERRSCVIEANSQATLDACFEPVERARVRAVFADAIAPPATRP